MPCRNGILPKIRKPRLSARPTELCQRASVEVANQGINVNCVSPGTVSREAGEDIDVFHETNLCRLGRSGTARENAELIAFLCTDKARYIVGQNILIDGGRSKI